MCTATLQTGKKTFIGPCREAHTIFTKGELVHGEIRKANGLWQRHLVKLNRSTPEETRCLLNCAIQPLPKEEFDFCKSICHNFGD
jgi:hypothetical protein